MFVHTQIRILLRLGIQLNNFPRAISVRQNFKKKMIITLASIYLKMLNININVLVNDPALLTEWYRFTMNFPKQVLSVIQG